MKVIKKLIEYCLLFILGGSVYYMIEILYRGHSHYTMFMVGGLCLILIGIINEFFNWNMYIELQIGLGLLIVLILEFLTGCIVNLWLGWGIWDYSNMPLNLLGQICLPFALLWIPLVFIAILLDDYIRYKLFNEEKPIYKSFLYEKIKLIFK